MNPKTNVKVIANCIFSLSKNSNVGSIFEICDYAKSLLFGTSAVSRVTFFANTRGNLMC